MDVRMQHSNHYNFNLPEAEDNVEISKLNENFETIDAELYDADQTAETAKGVTDALTNPEYVGTRPHVFAAGATLGNVGVSGALNVQSGGSVNVPKLGSLVVDPETTQLTSGNVAGLSDAGRVQPTSMTLEELAKTISGDFKQKTIEATALKVLSGAAPASGDVLVRTADNFVQASGVTLARLDKTVNNPNVGYWIDTASVTLQEGQPALYNINGGNVNSNTTLSAFLLGVAEQNAVDGVCRIVTAGLVKVFVYKDANLSYSSTFGLTGKAYDPDHGGAWQPATSNSDLGGFGGNTKRPKISLLRAADYTNMTDGTYALLDAYVCPV